MTAKRQTPAWRRYLSFWGSNITQDIDDELQFHIDMRTRDYIASGMDEETARQTALGRLGSIAAAREQCTAIDLNHERRMRRADLSDTIANDVRFALRGLVRSLEWTAVALMTIALGIGASTAVFSVVDRLLVRPISYPGSNRIFVVRQDVPLGPNAHVFGLLRAEHVAAWRSARSLDGLEGYARREVRLPANGESQVAHAVLVSATFLDFAGARPIVGRNFVLGETVPNGPGAALLSEHFWRRQFGAARDVVGKTMRTNGQSLTIVGVLPASLQLPDFDGNPADLWLPLVTGRDERLRGVVARLRPGITAAAAEVELDSITSRAGIAAPAPGSRMRLNRPGETLTFRRALIMLTGAVALLLLVACTNIAHLLLARGTARERELAVRFALGASRSRLVLQLVTESLVLSLCGGIAAVLVAVATLRLVVALRPEKLSALSHLSVNNTVLFVASVLAVVTGVTIGLLVGIRAARAGLGESLRVGAAGAGGHKTRHIRSSLVVTEIALSATLLVGALLLVHGVIRLQSTNLGFDARNLYGVTFPLRGTQLESAAQRSDFVRALLERGHRLPDISGATVAATIPPNGGFLFGVYETPEHPATSDNPSTVSTNSVSDDYFAVLGIPLAAGHTFDAGSSARNEVVINQGFANQLWPAGSPIGKRFRIAGEGPDGPGTVFPWLTVIGVTRDAVTHGLLAQKRPGSTEGVREPAVYTPISQSVESRVTLIARGREGTNPTAALRRLGSEMSAGATAPTIVGVEQALNDSLAEPRFSMIVLATFAGLGVILAAIGLYGVISYTVVQRTREIGIRMTLGATRNVIARMVVGDGLRLSMIGVGLGLLGATGATRLIQGALYGVERGDPWSFAAAAALLVSVSAAACLIPTLRATAIDPATAVRADG